MAIDPKSLRIGNRILYEQNSIEFTVIGIDKSGFEVENEEERTWIESDQFAGIPLSPSLLERAGFAKLNESYYEGYGIGFIVGYAVDGTFVVGNSFGPRHCHFYQFHQLQNVVYDLTGQELELKP